MNFSRVHYSKQPGECHDDSKLFLSSNINLAGMKVKKDQLVRCSSSPEASKRKPSDEALIAAMLMTRRLPTPILKQPAELTNFAHNRVDAARLEAQLGVNSRMICQRHRSFSSFSEESGRAGVFCCDNCMYRADRCMSCVTCVCCVQALFYHCATDQDGERGMGIDDPCSCNAPGKECLCRWSVLGILSIFMPCMVCYPFLRGFAKLFS